ncbi:MAG: hypothetical protein Q4D82_03745 [Neisseria sp.]|nr:hypothetical protein [Neisseria sp.]
MQINMGYLIIGGLFLVIILLTFLFIEKKKPQDLEAQFAQMPPPAPRTEVVQPEETAEWPYERAFRRWLGVLYQDNPRKIDTVVADVRLSLANEGIAEFSPAEVAAIGAGEEVDGAHAFAVDWKDSESFIAYAEDMAARFRFALQWTDGQRDTALPEELMQAVYPQFLAKNAVLYNAETSGDFYFLMIVPQRDSEEFEELSTAWGLNIRTADKPF